MANKLSYSVLGALALGAGAAQPPADLVLRHGRVVTVDAARPMAEAVAITGDRITAVGSDGEIAAFVGPRTEVIDLKGRLAVPGFIEATATSWASARPACSST